MERVSPVEKKVCLVRPSEMQWQVAKIFSAREKRGTHSR